MVFSLLCTLRRRHQKADKKPRVQGSWGHASPAVPGSPSLGGLLQVEVVVWEGTRVGVSVQTFHLSLSSCDICLHIYHTLATPAFASDLVGGSL